MHGIITNQCENNRQNFTRIFQDRIGSFVEGIGRNELRDLHLRHTTAPPEQPSPPRTTHVDLGLFPFPTEYSNTRPPTLQMHGKYDESGFHGLAFRANPFQMSVTGISPDIRIKLRLASVSTPLRHRSPHPGPSVCLCVEHLLHSTSYCIGRRVTPHPIGAAFPAEIHQAVPRVY